MKGLAVLVLTLIVTMVIAPAYAVVVEFKTDKTSYKKGDIITFSGKTDAGHANQMVSVRVTPPQGKSFLIAGGKTDADGLVEIAPVDTTQGKAASKMTIKGIYNASLIFDTDPLDKGKWLIFDYSLDGSPVSPSAAEIMGQQSSQSSAPSQPTTPTPSTQPTQSTTPTQPTSPTPPTQPTTPQSTTPKCGTGTEFDDASGTCVVAKSEPPAEPEKTTTTTKIPGFPDPNKDPQYYINRYKTEPDYMAWFDRNFPDQSIYEVLGVKGPKKTNIPGFPDPNKDPQYYIDRYNNEPDYKAWFDRNFPNDSIYDIVGVDAPAPESPPAAPSSCGAGTHLENGVCVLDKQASGQCAIATAAFGSELAPQVQMLREVRDNVLFSTSSGTTFMAGFNDFYYSFSPMVADWERQSPVFKEVVKTTITPMLSTLSILNYVSIDSEQEMLGYGIGIMLLNVGMYFVAPAFIIMKLGKRLKL